MSDAQYREGGGDTLPPYQEDFFQRIVNVSWSKVGGVFVAGDDSGGMFRGDIKNKDSQKWAALGTGVFGPYGAVYGVSYANTGTKTNPKPVFVAVGSWDFGQGGQDMGSGPLIAASNDGLQWSVVYKDYDRQVGPGGPGSYEISETIIGVVWDNITNSFYACGSAITLGIQFDNFWVDKLYRSSTGFNFSKVDEIGYGRYDIDPSTTTCMIATFCRKPENDGHIPDGYQAYSQELDIFAKPESLDGFFLLNGTDYGSQHEGVATPNITLKYNVKGGISAPATGPTTVSIGMPCLCVAQAGKVWLAGGSENSSIFSSFDASKTWALSESDPARHRQLLAISGGKRSEVLKNK